MLRVGDMPNLHLQKFFLIGYRLMWKFVSLMTALVIFYFHEITFLDGLGWTDTNRRLLQNIYELQLDVCQIKLRFTFKKNHREEMFTQMVASPKATKPKSFTFFLLSLDDIEVPWQQFSCPMEFPQCGYNWCINSENRDVSLHI